MAFDIDGPTPQEQKMSHIREEIQKLRKRGNVTLPELKKLSLNMWEREHLYPVLSDAALVYVIERCQKQIHDSNPYEPAVTYQDGLLHRLLPELKERFKEQSQQIELS